MIIVHIVDDKTVPIEQGQVLYKSLQEHKVACEFIELRFGGHGSKEFNSEETKKHILEFFGKCLKN